MVKHVPLFSITPVNRKQMAEKNIYLIDFFENYFVDDSIFLTHLTQQFSGLWPQSVCCLQFLP